eukprot:XP_011666251.1 PREDICTED: uncharacterized protein LOC100889372 [Strongylocentrotus purpuratus]
MYRELKHLLNKSKRFLPDADSSVELASTFCTFFSEKIRDLRRCIDDLNVDELDNPNGMAISAPSFVEFQLVTSEEVQRLIKRSPNKTCPLDPLPTWLLKRHLPVLLPKLTHIINASLASGDFPSSLGVASVTPVLKKPGLDKERMKNYRPISNIRFVAKLMERVVSSQLANYLEDNSLGDPKQSAYRKNHSTETALVSLQNDILCALDDRKCVILLSLDMSSAFDTLDHTILLTRLRDEYGVSGTALHWFRSYLSNRLSHVRIRGVKSLDTRLEFGVPQGSVPMARASILWLIGEYSDNVPKMAPDVLRKMAKGFINEEDIVKLQILNLAAKLYLTNSKQTKLLLQYVLNLAKYDQNYDIRDRARFFRLLGLPGDKTTTFSKHAKKIILRTQLKLEEKDCNLAMLSAQPPDITTQTMHSSLRSNHVALSSHNEKIPMSGTPTHPPHPDLTGGKIPHQLTVQFSPKKGGTITQLGCLGSSDISQYSLNNGSLHSHPHSRSLSPTKSHTYVPLVGPGQEKHIYATLNPPEPPPQDPRYCQTRCYGDLEDNDGYIMEEADENYMLQGHSSEESLEPQSMCDSDPGRTLSGSALGLPMHSDYSIATGHVGSRGGRLVLPDSATQEVPQSHIVRTVQVSSSSPKQNYYEKAILAKKKSMYHRQNTPTRTLTTKVIEFGDEGPSMETKEVSYFQVVTPPSQVKVSRPTSSRGPRRGWEEPGASEGTHVNRPTMGKKSFVEQQVARPTSRIGSYQDFEDSDPLELDKRSPRSAASQRARPRSAVLKAKSQVSPHSCARTKSPNRTKPRPHSSFVNSNPPKKPVRRSSSPSAQNYSNSSRALVPAVRKSKAEVQRNREAFRALKDGSLKKTKTYGKQIVAVDDRSPVRTVSTGKEQQDGGKGSDSDSIDEYPKSMREEEVFSLHRHLTKSGVKISFKTLKRGLVAPNEKNANDCLDQLPSNVSLK